MIDRTVVADVAARLIDAEQQRTPIAPVRDVLPDIDAAYAVQQESTRRWIGLGRRVIGRKIGLTSPAVQRQLGVDSPDFGVLFEDARFESASVVPFSSVLQPRIEAEVAFVLARDLDDDDLGGEHLAGAIAFITAALEVVGSRIANWDIAITDTIADNASSGACAVAAASVPLADVDLESARMELVRTRAGRVEVVSSGFGADCLGSPLNSTLWLAREMVRRGTPLRAGELVLTGALGPMVDVAPGDSFTATIDGVGSVDLSFSR